MQVQCSWEIFAVQGWEAIVVFEATETIEKPRKTQVARLLNLPGIDVLKWYRLIKKVPDERDSSQFWGT